MRISAKNMYILVSLKIYVVVFGFCKKVRLNSKNTFVFPDNKLRETSIWWTFSIINAISHVLSQNTFRHICLSQSLKLECAKKWQNMTKWKWWKLKKSPQKDNLERTEHLTIVWNDSAVHNEIYNMRHDTWVSQ